MCTEAEGKYRVHDDVFSVRDGYMIVECVCAAVYKKFVCTRGWKKNMDKWRVGKRGYFVVCENKQGCDKEIGARFAYICHHQTTTDRPESGVFVQHIFVSSLTLLYKVDR